MKRRKKKRRKKIIKKVNVKERIAVNWFPSQSYGRHLPYGITQSYLPPNTSEHAPPFLP